MQTEYSHEPDPGRSFGVGRIRRPAFVGSGCAQRSRLK